jgi:ectoine hydroxylase-related dioxygenase (phytanoyl-CoA dioxygenase family)
MGLGNDPSKYAETHDDWNHNRLVVRAEGAGSFKFGDLDTEIYRRAIRVSMREGSFVLWDQRVVHGSSPNDSHNFRVAQFIKGFRRDKVGSGRLKRRTSLIAKHLELAGEETKQVVTPLGRKLFGLE